MSRPRDLVAGAASEAVARARRAARRVAGPVRELRSSMAGEGSVEGLQHLPEDGPVLLAVNHRSLVDQWTLRSHLPRPLVVVDTHQLTEAVRRRRASEADPADAWRRALDTLTAGGMVVVFPEGDPGVDEAVHKGYDATGWLVLAAQRLPAGAGRVAVVPAALDAREAHLRLGEPLDFDRFAEAQPGRALARAVTDEVVEAIARVAGLPYVDTHVSTARAQRRGDARERRRRRRSDALVRRVALARAAEQRRVRADAEREDLAARAELAREEAYRHAERAAARERVLAEPDQ